MPETQFDFARKYEAANVAQSYAKEEDYKRANLALNEVKPTGDARALLEDKYYETSQGIDSASKAFAKRFYAELSEQTFTNLSTFYGTQISGLSKEGQANAKALFNKYGSKTLGSIAKEYKNAIEIINDPDGFKTKIEPYFKGDLEAEVKRKVQESEKIMKQYGPILNARSLLQEQRERPMQSKVTNQRLEEIVKTA